MYKTLIMKKITTSIRLFVMAGMLMSTLTGWSQAPTQIMGLKTVKNYTTIRLPEGHPSCKIMHITDAHITIPDATDSLIWDKCGRMHQAYKNTNSHPSKENISRGEAFRMLIDIAKTKKVDMVVLGGDIVNFPSPKTVEFVSNVMKESGLPFVYVAGNHDWHLEGTSGSDNQKRADYIHVLDPLYQGKNPLYNATMVNGINVVCIDNSTYQINREQLDFFKAQVKKGYPMILSIHIPVCTSLHSDCTMGNPKWGAAIDTSYELEGRQRWSAEGNTPETVEFTKLLKETPNIIILTGHVHVNRVETENNLKQFVTGLARDGHYRIMEFTDKALD